MPDTFKPFISNKNKESAAIHLKTEGDNAVKGQTEVAEILAKYFTNAVLRYYWRITSHKRTIVTTAVLRPYEKPGHKGTNFEFKLFTVAEVEQALEKINLKKSSVWDTQDYQNYLRMCLKEQQHL